ncbi:MAG TPA: shikimate kinase, partial [Pyrinomonadaceae bacterium]
LGGGTWTLERNRALIREHGCVTVWLDAPFALCWQRINSAPGARPLATDMERARTLYDERRTLYELAALHVEAAAGRSAGEIAAEIDGRLRRRQETR